MYEGFEMSERHRAIFAKHRVYLLHNMHPTEILWSSLIGREVLSMDMVEEIKSCSTTSEKLGLLLDMLPTRGPEAFDEFIEVLLESEHSHVAEYLKTIEATEKFRSEINPHCNNMSENLAEKFVKIFKRSTPAVQRFAERKFELILEDQAKDIEQREEELKTIENNNMMLQLEVSQLRSHINSCCETSENISSEINREFISKTFLREESKHIDNLKRSIKDIPEFGNVCKFYENIQDILAFLEKYTDAKSRDRHKEEKVRVASTKGRSLQDKMQVLTNMIIQAGDELGQKVNVPGIRVRSELEKIHQRFKDIVGDVFNVKEIFKNTMRQKRKLEGEVLAMLHNFQEIRRLDTECREKQSHVNELNKEANMVKKKIVANSRQSRKLSEQIQKNLEKKKTQLREVENDLHTQIKSADKRLQALVNLLPDLEDVNNNEFLRCDTEMTSEGGSQSESRMGTPSLGSIRPTSAVLENHTYRKLVHVMGDHSNGYHNHTSKDPQEHEQKVEDKHYTEGLHGSKMSLKETETKSPRKVVQKMQRADVSSSRTNNSNRLNSQNKNSQPTDVSANKPDTYSKEDIDKWLTQQKNNEHIRNVSKNIKISVSLEPQREQHFSHDNNDVKMETILESSPDSSRSVVTRSISMKETKRDLTSKRLTSQSMEADREKSFWETKTSSGSSRNTSSGTGSTPDCNAREDTYIVPKTSRGQARDELRSSKDKFTSASSEKFYLDRRRHSQQLQQQSIILSEQNANVAIETETTTELATSSRAARKSYSTLAKEKELEQKLKSGRETLVTKRIDLML